MGPRGSGKIVNMAFIAGISGLGMAAHYSAAKGGILAFTMTERAQKRPLSGVGFMWPLPGASVS